MKIWAKAIVAFFLILITASSCLAYDKAVEYVRSRRFNNCAYKTVGQSVDAVMERPQWSSWRGPHGTPLVDAVGVVTYRGRRYMANLQFEIHENGKFTFNALSFNNASQSKGFLKHFEDELCKD